MGGIKISSFSGIAPKLSNRMLPGDMGQIADNVRLISHGLRAFSDKVQITANALKAGGDVKTIFRMSNGTTDYWLSWLQDVDVQRGQVAGDTAQRIYWTGENEPRISNLALAIAGGGVMPNSCFVLGVSAPLVAPTVTPTGGVGATVSRAYVETFVTPWGEESAPSPVSTVTTGKVDDTWALTALNAAPINTSTISGATHSSGIVTVVTASTKHLRVGEEITHASIVGMTDLNGKFVITEVTDSTHYKVALTTAQTYTSGGTWTRVALHNTTGMTRRIYRTVGVEYFFVAEIDVATTTYNDTLLDAALGEVIPSTGWIMPPVGLSGLITLPNGFMAGFNGKDVCFSEPWRPHAWPAAYRLPCAFDVVALGAFGSSIEVGTKGVPYVITGSHPSGLSMDKSKSSEPCISKLSMVDAGIGIMYASPNGLAFDGVGGADLATKAIFSKDEWALINPATLRCNYHNGLVFGWHDINAELHTGFAFDPASGAFASTSMLATASYVDAETSRMYVVYGGAIYQWDAHPYNDLAFDWKSKVYALPKPVNFSYAKIDADFAGVSQINDAIAADIAFNEAVIALANAEADEQDVNSKGTLGASMLGEFMLSGGTLRGGSYVEYTSRTLRVTVYADGVEKYTESVLNNRPFSLPSGFKSSVWEFRISGNIPVHSLTVAESAQEMRRM